MDTRFYYLNLNVTLRPQHSETSPHIIICFNNKNIFTGSLDTTQTFNIVEHLPAQCNKITIEFTNKFNCDSNLNNNIDKAVIIESIEFNKISNPKFIWLGQYQPIYPEPWYSEQQNKPATVLFNVNYLGWNGVWSLEFTTPIFTWIHQVENLGIPYN